MADSDLIVAAHHGPDLERGPDRGEQGRDGGDSRDARQSSPGGSSGSSGSGRRVRRTLGWLILLAGAGLLMREGWTLLSPGGAPSVIGMALQAGLLAAAATALGTLPALGTRSLSDRAQDGLMGFGAGVMLAACAFSLILPGLAAAREAMGGRWRSCCGRCGRRGRRGGCWRGRARRRCHRGRADRGRRSADRRLGADGAGPLAAS